jgi:acetyl esterase/lipase
MRLGYSIIFLLALSGCGKGFTAQDLQATQGMANYLAPTSTTTATSATPASTRPGGTTSLPTTTDSSGSGMMTTGSTTESTVIIAPSTPNASTAAYSNTYPILQTCSNLPSASKGNTAKPSSEIYITHANDPHGPYKLDVLTPVGNGPFPLLILVHGGGWNSDTKELMETTANAYPLVSMGFAVASVDYRLSTATANRYPAAIQDLRCAVQYLRQPSSIATYHFDPNKVGIIGESAGGQIAAMVGTLGTQPTTAGFDSTECNYKGQSQNLQAVATFYGVFDFSTFGVPDPSIVSVPIANMVTTSFNDYLGGMPSAEISISASASPVNYVNNSTPPFFLTNGTADLVVPTAQSQEMANRLFNMGIPRTYVPITNAPHAFEMFGSKQPTAPAGAVNYTPSECTFVEFLNTVLPR